MSSGSGSSKHFTFERIEESRYQVGVEEVDAMREESETEVIEWDEFYTDTA